MPAPIVTSLAVIVAFKVGWVSEYLLASVPTSPMDVETLQVPTFLLAKVPVVLFCSETVSPTWIPERSALPTVAVTRPSYTFEEAEALITATGSVDGLGFGFGLGGGGGVTGGFGVEGTDELPPAPPPPPLLPLGTPPPAPPSPPAAVSMSPRPASLALSSLLSPAMGLLTAISNTRFPGSGCFDSPTKISPSEEIARPVAPVPLISPLACC